EASVSIISHQTIKELGLKIEELSKSLIVVATSTTSRPLEIIRNLPIRIQGQLILLDVEVVLAISYSILLDCLDNQYYSCNEFGHIEIKCTLAQLKLDNLTYKYGYNKNQIEERRMTYYSRRRTHHCCHCHASQQSDKLYKLEEKLACIAYYKTYYEALDPEDSRSQEYYNTGLGRETLVQCKLCNTQKPRSRMYNIKSIREELWFCKLEH
ncbi:18209_t:CDS:2, partial [Racocetra persica]